MENQLLTRIELYDLVWSKPLSHISNQYNISTDSIKTICEKYNIPLPKLGHRIKLEYGKEVEVIPLIPDQILDNKTIEMVELKKKVNPYMTRLNERTKEIIELFPSKSKSSQRLINPDPLVRKARSYLLSSKSKSYKMYGGVDTEDGMISICVSKLNILRACRFMDAFIKLMRARGHEFEVSWRETYVVVNDQHYKIRCREKCNRKVITEGTWSRSELVPNGKLSLKLDNLYEKEWSDTKTLMEDKVAQIVAGFEIRAEDDIAKKAQHEKDREKSRKLQEIRERFEAEQEWELKKVEMLKEHTAQWKLYKDVSDFISEVQNQSYSEASKNDELQNWLIWAREIEESINTLSKGLVQLIDQYSFKYK